MKRYKIRYKTVEALKNEPSYNPKTNRVYGKFGIGYIVIDYCKDYDYIIPEFFTAPDPMNFYRDAILFEEIIYED